MLTKEVPIGYFRAAYLDTCFLKRYNGTVLSLSHEKLTHEAELARNLRQELQQRTDWFVLPQVAEEYARGTMQIQKQSVGAYSQHHRDLLINLIKERNLTYLALGGDAVQRAMQINARISAIHEIFELRVRAYFLEKGGKPNDLDTDVKLVTAVLSHALYEPVGLFTQDELVQDTLVEVSKKVKHLSKPIFLGFRTYEGDLVTKNVKSCVPKNQRKRSLTLQNNNTFKG